MPKISRNEFVLQDWVSSMTFQMQALLLTGIRGPDPNNKHNSGKAIVRYLRGVVIKPAGNWSGENNNDWCWGDYSVFDKYTDEFWFDHDHFPHHFIMHLVHCSQVIGYKHPHRGFRDFWKKFYMYACEQFHFNPETEEQMDKRLNDFGEGVHNKQKIFL